MKMKRAILSAAVAAATLIASSATSFAQMNDVFRLFGQAIEADMHRQQLRREQQAAQQRQQQQQDELRREQIAVTKRLQSALATLGFYTKAIDGDFGPGTRASLNDFQRAFDLPVSDIGMNDVGTIENYAKAGFRSAAERAAARDGGFPSRSALLEAREGGFGSHEELQTAKSVGFRKRADYVAFKTSSFSDAEDFRLAREGGFDDFNTWRDAKAAGFAQRKDYEEFRKSGFADRPTWLSAKADRAERSKAREACLAASDASDAMRAVKLCAQAVLLSPADQSLSQQMLQAEAALATELQTLEGEAARNTKGAKVKLEAVRLASAEAKCANQRTAGDLRDAANLCAEQAQRFPASDLLKSASERLAAEATAQDAQKRAADQKRQEEAEAESKRIALQNAQEAAGTLLSAVEDYSALGARLQNGLEAARALVALRAALGKAEAEPIEQAMIRLNTLLTDDSGFSRFTSEREQAAKVATANASATALAESKRIETFVTDFVSRNVTHQAVPDLLEIQALLTDDIASGAPSRHAVGQKRAALAIASLGLGEELAAYTVAPQAEPATAPETAPNGLAVTGLNAEILAGPAEDILILHNATPDAPHAVRNLVGDLIFEGGRAVACWAHPVPEDSLAVSTALQRLREAGAFEFGAGAICEPEALAATDVIFLRRGDFLRANVLYARPFVERFENGAFRLLAKVAWAEIGAADAANAEFSATIEREVVAGARHGFGWLRFPVEGQAMCSVAGESAEAHLALFEARAPLAPDLPAKTNPTVMSLDRAFIQVQRRQCLLVYGSASDLAAIVAGAKRDNIDYSIIASWVTPDEVERTKAELAELTSAEQSTLAQVRRKAEADAARRQQEADSRHRLEAEQATAAASTKAAREAELRRTYSQEAMGAYNLLQQSAQRHLGDGNGDAAFAALFPDVAVWRSRKLGDGWSLEPLQGSLRDYGVASWKDRRLEVVFAEITIQSKNRTLGEIAEDCFVIGYLIDAEFEILRDSVASSCAAAEHDIAAWKQGRDFESRWRAE